MKQKANETNKIITEQELARLITYAVIAGFTLATLMFAVAALVMWWVFT